MYAAYFEERLNVRKIKNNEICIETDTRKNIGGMFVIVENVLCSSRIFVDVSFHRNTRTYSENNHSFCVFGNSRTSFFSFHLYFSLLFPQEQSHKSYRPLCVLTFRWNYSLHGLEPYGYHLVNMLLHLVVSLLYFRYVVFHLWSERFYMY